MNNVQHKIKLLLLKCNINQSQVSTKLGYSRQRFSAKLRDALTSFKLKDLISLANSTDSRLCFVDKDGNIIVEFNESDLIVDEQQETIE